MLIIGHQLSRPIEMKKYDDDIICSQCGGELDTGYECNKCGYDMYEEIFGVDFTTRLLDVIHDSDDSEFIQDFLRGVIIEDSDNI